MIILVPEGKDEKVSRKGMKRKETEGGRERNEENKKNRRKQKRRKGQE